MQAKKLVNACFGAKKACTYCSIKRAIKLVKSTTIELFSKHYLDNNCLNLNDSLAGCSVVALNLGSANPSYSFQYETTAILMIGRGTQGKVMLLCAKGDILNIAGTDPAVGVTSDASNNVVIT